MGITIPALAVGSNFEKSSFSAAAPAAEDGEEGDEQPAVATKPDVLSGADGVPLPPLALPLGAEPPADISKLLEALPAAPEEEMKKDSFGKPVEEKQTLADLPPAEPESSENVKPLAGLGRTPTFAQSPMTPPEIDLTSIIPPSRVVVTPPTEATSLPEVNVEAKEPKQKSWQVPLAAAITPPKHSFNYHREQLPATIYRQSYMGANKHLPIATSRVEYADMLFASAMRNDVEQTRALLNSGVNVNTLASNGETPLAAARRAGATATAQLLVARGGRY